MWTTFLKSLLKSVTILLLFGVLVFWPWGMWDFSYLTSDRTWIPCIGRQGLNHWTAKKVPNLVSWKNKLWEGVWKVIRTKQIKPLLGRIWYNVRRWYKVGGDNKHLFCLYFSLLREMAFRLKEGNGNQWLSWLVRGHLGKFIVKFSVWHFFWNDNNYIFGKKILSIYIMCVLQSTVNVYISLGPDGDLE